MKLLHPVNDRPEVGFSSEEKLDARIAIYGNILDSMEALIGAVEKFNISPKVSSHIKTVPFCDRAIMQKSSCLERDIISKRLTSVMSKS